MSESCQFVYIDLDAGNEWSSNEIFETSKEISNITRSYPAYPSLSNTLAPYSFQTYKIHTFFFFE